MSAFPVSSPSYGALTKPSYHAEASQPLDDQPLSGAIPSDDCEVSESELRAAYVRALYRILASQILAACIAVSAISQSSSIVLWIQTHAWSLYVPLLGAMVDLGLLYWQRHTYPWNLLFLSTFTLLQAITFGIVAALYHSEIVAWALLLALVAFAGLTMHAFRSNYTPSDVIPFLFGILIALRLGNYI